MTMDPTPFRGQVAVVTGAAGGIGAAIADRLAELGARVAALDIAHLPDRPAPPARVGTVREWTVDVRVGAQVEAAVAEVESELGPITQLVNAAGVLTDSTAVETPEKVWEDTFDVNATGVFRMSTAVARHMLPRRRGAIVTVASNAASVPRVGMAAYGASKAAAIAFTKVLGLELAGAGIRCNVVAPGSTDTAMLRSLWTDADGPSHSLDGDLAAYRVGIPLRRIASPRDVADAVVFLLSDQAAHITMHDLQVDGGAGLGR